MSPRFILAVTDFSAHGHHVLDRAALLSAEHAAVLKIAYLARPDEVPPADATTRLARHAAQLSQAHGIEAFAATHIAHTVGDLRAEVDAADLVVWGTAPWRGMSSFFLGQPWERLVRTAQRPVLVVQRPATQPHRRVLIAVDFADPSPALVDVGRSLGPSVPVELLHAISTAHEGKLRYAEVSEQAIRTYRGQCRRHAEARMARLTRAVDARHGPLVWTIAHGDPVRQTLLQHQRSGADLVVVGKRPSAALSDLFFGSMANRLMRVCGTGELLADVLVVPHDRRLALRRAAPARRSDPRFVTRRVRAGAPEAPGWPQSTTSG